MKSVVVSESMYGNGHRVANRVGAVLSESGPVNVVPVSAATSDLIAGADLVVVGGPTHIHSMSTRKSRSGARDMAVADAEKKGKEPPRMDPNWQDPGLRDWFGDLPKSGGQFAAAFDTRVDARALLTGRASRLIARKLRRAGFHLIEPESFLVDDTGSLMDSEADRAARWAAGLATAVQADDHTSGDWTAQ